MAAVENADLTPVYQPALRQVSDIVKGNPTHVETTFAHSYLTGTIVRMYVPKEWGMEQIDLQKGIITVTSTTTFTIDINSTGYDAFVTPDTPVQYAFVIPIGEVPEMLTAAVRNVLPY